MTKRFLTWAFDRFPSGGVMLPAYYMETDYEPVAVRVYADSGPQVLDAKFDILVDGVSIFSDTTEVENSPDVNYQHQHVATTSIELPASATDDTMAENFKDGLTIDEGSWVTCKFKNDGGARNVSIHLELITVSESNEDDE